MSIIKSILHKYNATSKAYDTLHPETESAQITDWHKAVVNSLASTTLPAVVSALTTDSVMGKLMKLLLTASGVKYSIATNGYVCLGDFFGGLIIQWVYNENTTSRHMTYPISFSDIPALTISSAYQLGLYPYNESATGFDYKLASDGSSIGKNIMHGIAIGY